MSHLETRAVAEKSERPSTHQFVSSPGSLVLEGIGLCKKKAMAQCAFIGYWDICDLYGSEMYIFS